MFGRKKIKVLEESIAILRKDLEKWCLRCSDHSLEIAIIKPQLEELARKNAWNRNKFDVIEKIFQLDGKYKIVLHGRQDAGWTLVCQLNDWYIYEKEGCSRKQ